MAYLFPHYPKLYLFYILSYIYILIHFSNPCYFGLRKSGIPPTVKRPLHFLRRTLQRSKIIVLTMEFPAYFLRRTLQRSKVVVVDIETPAYFLRRTLQRGKIVLIARKSAAYFPRR